MLSNITLLDPQPLQSSPPSSPPCSPTLSTLSTQHRASETPDPISPISSIASRTPSPFAVATEKDGDDYEPCLKTGNLDACEAFKRTDEERPSEQNVGKRAKQDLSRVETCSGVRTTASGYTVPSTQLDLATLLTLRSLSVSTIAQIAAHSTKPGQSSHPIRATAPISHSLKLLNAIPPTADSATRDSQNEKPAYQTTICWFWYHHGHCRRPIRGRCLFRHHTGPGLHVIVPPSFDASRHQDCTRPLCPLRIRDPNQTVGKSISDTFNPPTSPRRSGYDRYIPSHRPQRFEPYSLPKRYNHTTRIPPGCESESRRLHPSSAGRQAPRSTPRPDPTPSPHDPPTGPPRISKWKLWRQRKQEQKRLQATLGLEYDELPSPAPLAQSKAAAEKDTQPRTRTGGHGVKKSTTKSTGPAAHRRRARVPGTRNAYTHPLTGTKPRLETEEFYFSDEEADCEEWFLSGFPEEGKKRKGGYGEEGEGEWNVDLGSLKKTGQWAFLCGVGADGDVVMREIEEKG